VIVHYLVVIAIGVLNQVIARVRIAKMVWHGL